MTIHFVNLLDELLRRSLRMASQVEDMLSEACDAMIGQYHRLAQRVIERDEEVDAEEVEVETETIRLMALYQPVGSDLRLLCTVLKVNSDLERIADCAVNIAERACHLGNDDQLPGMDIVEQMVPVVRRALRAAVNSYACHDKNHCAEEVFAQEEIVNALYAQVIKTVISENANEPHDLPPLLDLLSIAKNLERIADHATNIAEDVVFLATGDIIRHQARKDLLSD